MEDISSSDFITLQSLKGVVRRKSAAARMTNIFMEKENRAVTRREVNCGTVMGVGLSKTTIAVVLPSRANKRLGTKVNGTAAKAVRRSHQSEGLDPLLNHEEKIRTTHPCREL